MSTDALPAVSSYNAEQPSRYSLAECRALVGRSASLTLTGQIVEAGESDSGAFVRFQPDERFGFGDFRFGLDVEALDVSAL